MGIGFGTPLTEHYYNVLRNQRPDRRLLPLLTLSPARWEVTCHIDRAETAGWQLGDACGSRPRAACVSVRGRCSVRPTCHATQAACRHARACLLCGSQCCPLCATGNRRRSCGGLVVCRGVCRGADASAETTPPEYLYSESGKTPVASSCPQRLIPLSPCPAWSRAPSCLPRLPVVTAATGSDATHGYLILLPCKCVQRRPSPQSLP